MERQQLDVTVRESLGKGPARRARMAGAVPGVVYGQGQDPVSIQIDDHSLHTVLRAGANTLVDLKGPDPLDGKLVLIKEIQRDPVSQRLVHCDLYAVNTKKKITVNIPIHITGKAKGIDFGGILEPIIRDLEVRCLPLAIPDSIEVDVTSLDVGDAIHIADLTLPDAVEVIETDNLTVIHVVAPRVEETKTEEEEAAEGAEGDAAAATGDADKAKAEGDSGSAS